MSDRGVTPATFIVPTVLVVGIGLVLGTYLGIWVFDKGTQLLGSMVRGIGE